MSRIKLTVKIPLSFDKNLKKMAKKMKKAKQQLIVEAIAKSIEDFIDLKAARKTLSKKRGKTYTFDEVKKELGI